MRTKRLLLAAIAALAACQTVPYTGRKNLVLIPAAEESRMGLSAYQEALSRSKAVESGSDAAMVRRVGERLAKAADKPDFEWEFKLLDDDKTINAWCLPGGKVAVYTGLLKVARGEEGLAVVMGHEIAHALARHGAERMSQGMVAQLGAVGLAAAARDKPAETQELWQQAYGLGVGVGVLLPYSRAQESEADEIGLHLMREAGYDPRAAVAFWERMAAATGGGGDDPLSKYLGTHPPAAERIAAIKKWLAGQGL